MPKPGHSSILMLCIYKRDHLSKRELAYLRTKAIMKHVLPNHGGRENPALP